VRGWIHPARMGTTMLPTSVLQGGVSSSPGTKSHRIPPFGHGESWTNRLPTPATSFAKGLRGRDAFGRFSVCLEAISFPLSVTRRRGQVDAVLPAPITTEMPSKPSRHFSSLQDIQTLQGFPSSSPRIDASLVESQPGTTRDARQPLLPARRANWGALLLAKQHQAALLCQMWLPDVRIHPVALSLARELGFGCTEMGN